jgi:hypothetical protein
MYQKVLLLLLLTSYGPSSVVWSVDLLYTPSPYPMKYDAAAACSTSCDSIHAIRSIDRSMDGSMRDGLFGSWLLWCLSGRHA